MYSQLPAEEYPPHSRAMSAGAYITWAEDTDATVIEANNGGGNLGRVMLGYVSLKGQVFIRYHHI